MKIKPWVSGRLEVKDSGTEGKGVYAAQDIKEGEVIGIFGGIVIPEGQLDELSRTIPEEKLCVGHAMYIYPGFIMLHDYENGCDPLCFANHSCDPNSKVVNGIVFIASRDIPAGEEVCWNYKETDDVGNWSYEFKCQCGAPNCEGWVRVGPQYRDKVKVNAN